MNLKFKVQSYILKYNKACESSVSSLAESIKILCIKILCFKDLKKKLTCCYEELQEDFFNFIYIKIHIE